MWSLKEVALYCHVGDQKDYPVIFGQLTKRDGSFLMGRTDEKDTFKWSDLNGKKIIAGRKGGVPAMSLQYALTKNNVPITTSTFDTSVAFNLIAETFVADTSYEYCTMFEPAASEYAAQGKGYIVASVGEESGEIPFTAFAAKKKYINDNKDKVTAFLRAVVKGYNFMCDNEPETVAAALLPQFPSTSVESIATAIKSYLEIDAWSSTPVMSKSAFERLQDIMEGAGELSKRADYTKAVYNDIAMQVA